MKTRRLHNCLAFAVALFTTLAQTLGLPGELDNTFGGTGIVTTSVGSGDDYDYSIALQSDGKIVVAGFSDNGSAHEAALARYNSDGSLDLTFSGDGKVTTAFGSLGIGGTGVAVQSDGRIVVSAISHNGIDNDFVVLRYNSSGALDTSFSGDGIVTTDVSNDIAFSVALQSDGKILIAGYTQDDFALLRYDTNGSLDTTFNGTGKVITTLGPSYDTGWKVAVQSDGKIVMAGSSNNGNNDDFAVVRYNANGSLDLGFGSGGKVTTAIGSGDDVGYGLAVQSDGKIVVSGSSHNGSDRDFAVVRYNPNGSLDMSFNGSGKVTAPVGAGDDWGLRMVLQSNGKIVVIGDSYNGSSKDLAVVRFNNDGSLDTNFNGTGKVTTPIGSGDDTGNSVVVQTDGKIVVAASAFIGGNADFVVVRYLGGEPPPLATTDVANAITATDAILNGNVNPSGTATDAWFEYWKGMDAPTVTTAQPVGSGAVAVPFSQGVSGLMAHTEYSFRAKASNAGGGAQGAVLSFTTLNTPPVAMDDVDVPVAGYGAVAVAVLDNDSDADGDDLSVVAVTQGAHGAVAIDAGGGGVSYTAGAGFCHDDSFTYTISDGFGGLATAVVTVKGSVAFVVAAVGKGDPVAGEAAGTVYQAPTAGIGVFPGTAAVNASGALAFRGYVKPAGLPSKLAILAGEPPVVVSRKDDAAPDGAGAPLGAAITFKAYFDPLINAAGAVAWKATLNGATTTTNDGVWTNATSGPAGIGALRLAVREGDQAAGCAVGTKVGAILNVGLSDTGAVTFVANLVGAGVVTAGSAPNNAAVWQWKAGVTTLLLRRGQSLTIGGSVVKVSDLGALNGAVYGRYNSPDGGLSILGDKVMTRTKLSGAVTTAVLILEPGQPITVAAATNGAVPTAPAGALWGEMGIAAFHPTGDLALNANLSAGTSTITSTTNAGVFADVPPDTLALIAQKGSVAPGTGVAWKDFLPPSVNAERRVAFSASLVSGGGITGVNDYGLWWTGAGGVELVAREGAIAPGPEGGTWVSIGKGTSSLSFALPDGMGPVFRASVRFTNADSSVSTRAGLWAVDSGGVLRFLFRQNGRVNVGGTEWEPTRFSTLLKAPFASGQIRSTNSRRELVLNATLKSTSGPAVNTQAILKVCLP